MIPPPAATTETVARARRTRTSMSVGRTSRAQVSSSSSFLRNRFELFNLVVSCRSVRKNENRPRRVDVAVRRNVIARHVARRRSRLFMDHRDGLCALAGHAEEVSESQEWTRSEQFRGTYTGLV